MKHVEYNWPHDSRWIVVFGLTLLVLLTASITLLALLHPGSPAPMLDPNGLSNPWTTPFYGP